MNGKIKSVAACHLVLLLAVILMAFQQAQPVRAASGSGEAIGFEDDAPLEATWSDPLTFVVLNNTTLELQVKLEIGDFVPVTTGAGEPAGEPVALIQVPVAVFTLPATARKTMTVAFNQNLQPVPGSYEGWLTLSTGQPATVIRKAIRLSVPIPVVDGTADVRTTEGAVPPAVQAWTLQAYRLLPGLRPVCFRNLSFACTLPVAVTNPPATAKQGYIGTLDGDRGGGMTVAIKSTRKEMAVLALDFSQFLAPVGAYSATLDFLPTDASAGEVALTVNVKDTFITPLIAVGLGILLAQWVQFYLGVRRGVMQIERRLAQVTVDFEAVPNAVISGYSIRSDVIVQRDAIADALADWSTRQTLKPPEEEAARFKAAVLDPLEKLEKSVQAWAGFDAQLEALRKVLDLEVWPAIQKTRPPVHLNLDAPRFYIVARALLRGRPISLRDFAQRQDVIDEAMTFARMWGTLDNVRETVAEALDFVSQYRFQLSMQGQQDLELARRKLNEVHRELWEAENLTRLRVLRTTDDLEDAKSILNQLMGFIEAGPEETEAPVPEGVELVGPWSADGGRFLGSFDMSVLRTLRARLWGIVPPSLSPAQPGSMEAARQRIVWLDRALLAGDFLLIALAYAAAVVAGLKPYFTTNFGSLYDYLSAFTWGFGAKAVLEIANAALEKLLANSE